MKRMGEIVTRGLRTVLARAIGQRLVNRVRFVLDGTRG
jgi:hypothetical protein